MSEDKLRKCTFDITPTVRVEIRGESHPKGYPFCRRDGGLVKRFLQFLIDEDIYTTHNTGGSVGGGSVVKYFSAEDAGRIRVWLVQQPEIQEGMKHDGEEEVSGDG